MSFIEFTESRMVREEHIEVILNLDAISGETLVLPTVGASNIMIFCDLFGEQLLTFKLIDL